MSLVVTHVVGGSGQPPAGLQRAPVCEGNLLRQRPGPLGVGAAKGGGGPVLCWSGWTSDQADPASGSFPLDLALWGPGAWDGMLEACRQAREAGVEVALRPHPRHVLSDAQRCLRFLEAGGGGAGGAGWLALEPAAMLTESMLPDAEEHLERTFAALAQQAGVWGLLLTGVEGVPGAPGELRACPLTRGVLAPEVLLGVARRWWPAGPAGPVAILGEDVAGQLELVRGGDAPLQFAPTDDSAP